MTHCMLQGKRFYCREWAFQKLLHSLENRQNAKTCGTLIVGGPGSGKTAFCAEMVWPTASHGKQRNLSRRVVAYHFCQSHDVETLSVGKFIRGLVNQISRSTAIHGFDEKVRDPSIQAVLEPSACEHNPDDAFKHGILLPLRSLNPPQRSCFILVDSVDEGFTKNEEEKSGSRNIAELLSNHHEFFPPWLNLICSARRQSKSVTRLFTGFRKLSLDDLRKSHVVRDVQQYILCRLDREESLRNHLSRETAEMLNQLHIKSNGCIMYLEKVLDGVGEDFIPLADISQIPGTLNGLYLWLCQRLFVRKQFAKIQPILNVLLVAKRPLSEAELFLCVRTRNMAMTFVEFNQRIRTMSRILIRTRGEHILLFHHSFTEWLVDVKHCTQKYLCSCADGNAMLALRYSGIAKELNASQVYEFAEHMLKANLAPPMDNSQLALWLLQSGAPVEECIVTASKNTDPVNELLIKAGAKVVGREIDPVTFRNALQRTESVNDLLDGGASVNQVDDNGRSLLSNAAFIGNVDVVKVLMNRGADVDVADKTGQTAISLASRQGHSDIVDVLIKHKGNLDHTDHEGWTPLRSAAWAGHTDVVTALLAAGANVDSCDADKRTALRAAAWGGHEDIVLKLLEHNANVNQVDNEGRTALIAAAYMGHSKIVEHLLDHGAEINHQDRDGRTALTVAALCVPSTEGHAEVVKLLIQRNAQVDHCDHDGLTPLLVSAYEGYYEVVEMLLEGGADIDHCDENNRTPLIASASMGHVEIVRTLLKWGTAVDTMDNDGRTVLSIAAAQGNADIVKMLLERGLDEMHRDHAGWTPLHMAAFEGNKDVIEIFLQEGAQVHIDTTDRDGRTPLILAAEQGHLPVVVSLIQSGADPDITGHDGRSALRSAAMEGHKEVVEFLIHECSNINYKDGEGRTTVYMLSLDNKISMANVLLQNGAGVDHPDLEGRSPLHVASWQGHSEMVSLLLTHQANPNAMDNEKRTPLQSAAWQGNVEVVQLLMKYGANINQTCNQGATALCISAQEGHMDVVDALLKHGADPNHADEHGRTAMRVAVKGEHQSVIKLLVDYGVPIIDSPRGSHSSRSGGSVSSNDQRQSTGQLSNGLQEGSTPSDSPDSTFDKKQSLTHSSNTKSSSNLTSTSSTNRSSGHVPSSGYGDLFTEQIHEHSSPDQFDVQDINDRCKSPNTSSKVSSAASFQTIPENISSVGSHYTGYGSMPHKGGKKSQQSSSKARRRSPSPNQPTLQTSAPVQSLQSLNSVPFQNESPRRESFGSPRQYKQQQQHQQKILQQQQKQQQKQYEQQMQRQKHQTMEPSPKPNRRHLPRQLSAPSLRDNSHARQNSNSNVKKQSTSVTQHPQLQPLEGIKSLPQHVMATSSLRRNSAPQKPVVREGSAMAQALMIAEGFPLHAELAAAEQAMKPSGISQVFAKQHQHSYSHQQHLSERCHARSRSSPVTSNNCERITQQRSLSTVRQVEEDMSHLQLNQQHIRHQHHPHHQQQHGAIQHQSHCHQRHQSPSPQHNLHVHSRNQFHQYLDSLDYQDLPPMQRKASLPASFNQVNGSRVLNGSPSSPESSIRGRRCRIRTNPNYSVKNASQNKLNLQSTPPLQKPKSIFANGIATSNGFDSNHSSPTHGASLTGSSDGSTSLSPIEIKQAIRMSFEGPCTVNGFKKETPL
ncbi:ankyrin repeat domain-containing protein 50-like [Anneissia japonica]|uniref:ankyrin repeat domain-containing protein 50-like n=1 Tax=Anneissia japonica TaxID=1529436 RepID=UPI0014256F10|nr:ankyrin repeat domain-containing protein 50-like [Anneissia japonica]XP_033106877.1 ankyrin repeat domain-containing protein 50-like [Anneissia japonica]XP_033106878.1 ankyrin repeat domain-containing protein 50-like [Anneissia japonica]XP_033106879.1 ankyrin repeat domain-containing protein 50-like [Anneissia japonica]XP_033106881.1 ankyrin repeat domain-containing protein 50-like [Anneissia japonica]